MSYRSIVASSSFKHLSSRPAWEPVCTMGHACYCADVDVELPSDRYRSIAPRYLLDRARNVSRMLTHMIKTTRYDSML